MRYSSVWPWIRAIAISLAVYTLIFYGIWRFVHG
jgi:hypothetical protein